MIIGHYGLALGAKRLAPSVSLGTLFLAAALADLLWPLLVLTGAEAFQIRIDATKVVPIEFMRFPYSHSLVALGFAAVVFCAVRAIIRRTPAQALVVLGALVLSHWLLDVASHGPDVPVSPNSEGGLGMGLWNSVPGTVIVEGLLLAAGAAVYATSTSSVNRVGAIGLWVLIALMAGAFLAIVFGPVPQTQSVVLGAAGAMWVFVIAAYWIDRNHVVSLRRDTRSGSDRARASASAHVRRPRPAARAEQRRI
jgi:hypothetical protein